MIRAARLGDGVPPGLAYQNNGNGEIYPTVSPHKGRIRPEGTGRDYAGGLMRRVRLRSRAQLLQGGTADGHLGLRSRALVHGRCTVPHRRLDPRLVS